MPRMSNRARSCGPLLSCPQMTLVSASRKIVGCIHNISRDVLPNIQLGQAHLDGSDQALSLYVHSPENALDEHGFTKGDGHLKPHYVSPRERGNTPATCVPELQGGGMGSRSPSSKTGQLGITADLMVPQWRSQRCDLDHSGFRKEGITIRMEFRRCPIP